MRRPLRWSFNLCAAVSAVLLVGVSAMWARSYAGTAYLWDGQLRLIHMRSSGLDAFIQAGDPTVHHYPDDLRSLVAAVQRNDPELWDRVRNAGVDSSAWRLAGIECHRGQISVFALPKPMPYTLLAIPLRTLVLLFLALPAAWVVGSAAAAIRSNRRRHRGICLRCGYDLRGNTSGRCSECGEPVTAERRVKA